MDQRNISSIKKQKLFKLIKEIIVLPDNLIGKINLELNINKDHISSIKYKPSEIILK